LDKQLSAIKIAFLDVGQGDTIVISSPDTREAIVVDCIDADAVLDYLKQEQILYLRSIIVTHLHNDHCSQVDSLIYRHHIVSGMGECEKLAFRDINKKHENYEVLVQDKDGHQKEVLVQDEDGHQEEQETGFTNKYAKKQARKTALENLKDWYLEDKRKYIVPNVQPGIYEEAAEKPLPLKGIKGDLAKNIYLLHPFEADLSNLEVKGLNNTSVILRIISSGSSALLTGDLEPHGWYILQKNYPDHLRSDILKFPHHGGMWNAADTKSLLDSVQPSVVVISVGTNGEKYKHPNKDVFSVLSSPQYSHIRVLCTQATNQCRVSVLDCKQPVIQHLDRQASEKGNERIGSKRGCPCAGTVIVEIADNACVLQPTVAFHQNNIIHLSFHAHKCVLR